MTAKLLPSEFLNAMRRETDPVADRVVAAILASDEVAINDVFNRLTQNRDIKNASLPSVVKSYFEENARLPDWADHDKLHIGQDVFRRYGVEVSILLNFLSLPSAYACWRGAKVLRMTGRLTDADGNVDHLTYRLMETAQFVIDVMQPGAFHPEADGIVTVLKIRLIHASIRHFVKSRSNWDVDTFGEPINQEDMAGTLMSFSSLIIHGLEKMGVRLTDQEREGYFHCWQVVGHLIGLRPELIPANYPDGLKLGFQILDEQKGASKDGEELLNALVDFVNKILPDHLFRNYLPVFFIRYFIGANVGDVLKFRTTPKLLDRLTDLLFHFLSAILTLIKAPLHHLVKGRIGRMKNHFLQGMINHFNNRKKIFFDIPPSLRGDWNIDSSGRVIGLEGNT